MKILAMGAGAIGSVFGGFLSLPRKTSNPLQKAAGLDVSLVGRFEHMQAIKEKGLHISGIWGEHYADNLKTFASVQEVIKGDKDFDLILLTVKSYDTREAIEKVTQAKLVGENTWVISLQNGLGNLETIAEIVGKEKTIGGRVIFGAELVKPGWVKVTVYADKVILGKAEGKPPDERLEEIARVFTECGIPTATTEGIEKFIWGKILYNCALNGLGTILEVPYGRLAERKESRWIMEEIIKEIFLLAKKKRVKLFWEEAGEYLRVFYDSLVPPTKEHYSSMLQDIKRGKRTEIDALNGSMVELAKKEGLSLPVNQVVTDLVKFKEKKIALTIDSQ